MRHFLYLFFLFVAGCEHPTNSGESLFSYQIDNFDGNGFYPIPDGVYAQYTDTRLTSSYNPDSILVAAKKTGAGFRDAWDIRFQYTGNVYPAALLYLRLSDSTQLVDTSYFHFSEKPIINTKALIKHYYFK